MTNTAAAPQPTDEELFSAFFSGNKELVNPYETTPTELRDALLGVWFSGYKAARRDAAKEGK